MSARPERPRTRFRRRLLWTLVLTGVLPVAAVGLVGARMLDEVLALSLSPVEQVLDETDALLQQADRPPPARLTQARLRVAQAELARESLRRITVWSFGAVSLAALLGSVATAVLLGRSFSRPVAALSEGMARVARGELDARVAPREHADRDELAYMVAQFNRMAGELQEQRARLEVTERLAAWQEVARALAHELRNPLTAMKMALARIARIDPLAPGEADRARLRESAGLLEEQVDALMRMTQSFSEFARLPAARPAVLELGGLVRDVGALYAGAGDRVRVAAPAALTVRADADQLRRALGNLIKNALEASPPDAPVEVTVDREGPLARVTVRDRGPGVPEPLLRGRFLEGLSQKPGGSGLGLPITQKIVHEHGGELALSLAEGGGTKVVLRLPAEEG